MTKNLTTDGSLTTKNSGTKLSAKPPQKAQVKQDPYFQSFIKYIREKELLQAGDRVLICISGGLDSTCLAHLMHKAMRLLGITVNIVHVDHGLRGLKSSKEGTWVSVMGQRLNLPVHCLKVKPSEKSNQLELRELRRTAIKSLAENLNCNKIATAHHADDNAETFLMRAVSGTGINGLRGMRPANENWIKPMLGMTRSQLEDYAREYGVYWVEDESNQSDRYLRNRVRQQLFPLLESVRPASIKNLAKAAERMDEEEQELEDWLKLQLAGKKNQIAIPWLKKWPLTLRRRILRVWLGDLQIEAHSALIESLLTGRDVIHAEGAFLIQGPFIKFHHDKNFSQPWCDGPLALPLNQRIQLGSSIAWSFLPESPAFLKPLKYSLMMSFRQPNQINDKSLALNWSLLSEDLCIRSRSPRDPVDLQIIFDKYKIPKPFQKKWPVLAYANNPEKVIAAIGLEVLSVYRYRGVGRCVALKSFFEQSLSA